MAYRRGSVTVTLRTDQGPRVAVTDAFRGPDGQAPFGPAAPAPAGAGPADQLAAFLGRPV